MSTVFQPYIEHFTETAREHFAHQKAVNQDVSLLFESMEYSLLGDGKRFRPLTCFVTAKTMGLDWKMMTPFALALECIHTYSLIHDDLPCMDDDTIRRGQPTNHIKFNQEIALLAGDALLTEAFSVLTLHPNQHSLALIQLLSEGGGLAGMIRGQVLDLGHGSKIESLSDLIHLHELKTGRLISMGFEASAIMANHKPGPYRELGHMIGLAFQVKDDLLDIDEQDKMSFIAFLGQEGTEQYLATLTEKISFSLEQLNLNSEELQELVLYNLNRKK